MPKPHYMNVPGDFYVEDGCCITCAVPLEKAPQFLKFVDEPDGSAHCYVHTQPRMAGERTLMAEAMQSADGGCIRYRGSDQSFRKDLVERELGDLVDD